MGSTAPAPGSPDSRSAPRVLLTRVLPAVLGMALLIAFGYLGIGYLVWQRSFIFSALIGGDRAEHLQHSYATAADTFLPGDRDGDGASDGLELFYGTDPEVARGHPRFAIEWARPGFIAYDYPSILPGGSTRRFVYYDVLPQPDQPLRLRGRLTIAGRHHRVTSSSLRLTPPPGTALGPPAGPSTPGPLLLPMDAEGRFAFEAHRLPEAVVDEDSTLEIVVANALTGERLDTIDIRYLPASAQPLLARVVPSEDTGERIDHPYGHLRTEEIEWPRAPAGTRALLLQAARPEPDAPWISLQLYPPDRTTATIARLLGEPRYPYTGPLRYRILPLVP